MHAGGLRRIAPPSDDDLPSHGLLTMHRAGRAAPASAPALRFGWGARLQRSPALQGAVTDVYAPAAAAELPGSWEKAAAAVHLVRIAQTANDERTLGDVAYDAVMHGGARADDEGDQARRAARLFFADDTRVTEDIAEATLRDAARARDLDELGLRNAVEQGARAGREANVEAATTRLLAAARQVRDANPRAAAAVPTDDALLALLLDAVFNAQQARAAWADNDQRRLMRHYLACTMIRLGYNNLNRLRDALYAGGRDPITARFLQWAQAAFVRGAAAGAAAAPPPGAAGVRVLAEPERGAAPDVPFASFRTAGVCQALILLGNKVFGGNGAAIFVRRGAPPGGGSLRDLALAQAALREYQAGNNDGDDAYRGAALDRFEDDDGAAQFTLYERVRRMQEARERILQDPELAPVTDLTPEQITEQFVDGKLNVMDIAIDFLLRSASTIQQEVMRLKRLPGHAAVKRLQLGPDDWLLALSRTESARSILVDMAAVNWGGHRLSLPSTDAVTVNHRAWLDQKVAAYDYVLNYNNIKLMWAAVVEDTAARVPRFS